MCDDVKVIPTLGSRQTVFKTVHSDDPCSSNTIVPATPLNHRPEVHDLSPNLVTPNSDTW